MYIQSSAKEKQKDKENDEEKGKVKDKGKGNGEGREIGIKDVEDDEETLSIDKDSCPQLSSTFELANIENSVESINHHRIIASATIPLDNRKDKDNSDTDENRKDKDNSETDENKKDKDNSDTEENRANTYSNYKQAQELRQEKKHGNLHGHNNNKNSYDDRDDQARKTRENAMPILSNHPHPHAHLHLFPKSGMLVAAADEIINHQQHSSSANNRPKTKNTMTQTDTNTQSQSQTHTRIEKEKDRGKATLELFASQSPSEFIITPQDQSPYPTNIEAYTGKLRLYFISYGKNFFHKQLTCHLFNKLRKDLLIGYVFCILLFLFVPALHHLHFLFFELQPSYVIYFLKLKSSLYNEQ